ncbi:MAG: sodium:proton antiporter NhaD [Gammaproteobacteria bacterium]|nr:sodium:proton antiporter NhaD [Gammaproteobacteria bacterium]MBL6999195.1 sodium:proton antiporter NhaD [Gammaproteobacteria bacterium]
MKTKINPLWALFTLAAGLLLPFNSFAEMGSGQTLDLTQHWVGYTAIAIFVLAYMLVMAEEFMHLRKSKPVVLAAGIIWLLVALVYSQHGDNHTAEAAVRHNILEFGELFLFLLVAMTYINAMEERLVFDALKSWLVRKGFTLRQLFWITGIIAFFVSPVADNLTTALLMCAVVMAVGGENKKFILLACINIVVAANAGGAFSPFGDITTLMVWQKGLIDFWTFFTLFIPAVVNFVVPAAIMSFAVSKDKPDVIDNAVPMKKGALVIVGMFIMTIATAVSFHNFAHLPPVAGMMTGLSYLMFYGYYLKKSANGKKQAALAQCTDEHSIAAHNDAEFDDNYDIFNKVKRAEWDTLFFFYGVILCVGGLGLIGYLSLVSEFMYVGLGATTANIMVGVLSAIVDNIPVMFAILTMNPEMSQGQWLLATLTAGVGGSMLSIGSAAGVALMGQARGYYTFFGHLKWTPVIALGYGASIYAHFLVNAARF